MTGVDLRNGSLTGDVSMTVQSGFHPPDPGGTPHLLEVAHTLRDDGFDASEDGTDRGTPLVPEVSPTLFASEGGVSSGYHPVVPVAYQCHGNNVGPMGTLRKGDGGITSGVPFLPVPYIVNAAESCAVKDHARLADVARCIDSTGSFASAQGGTVALHPVAFNHQAAGKQTSLGYDPDAGTACTLSISTTPAIAWRWAVRRLTPLECERLQGFPDGWTLVPFRGKPMADGPRYKMVGNSIAVNAMRWIGTRIDMTESLGVRP